MARVVRRARSVQDPRIDAFLAGDRAVVVEVEGWIRTALGGFRAVFAHELDDVVQETLLELTRALGEGRYRGDGSFGAYVGRLSRFHAIDRWRRRRRVAWTDLEGVEPVSPAPGPARRVETEDRLRELLRWFAAMPEDCQRLWRMIVRGWSYRRMSEETGVSAGTLRVRVLRCRQRATAAFRSSTEGESL